MKICFQPDADIDPDIRTGLLRREPTIDFRAAGGTIPDGTLDSEVLQIAAEDDRVLVSGDLRTMSLHFQHFVAAFHRSRDRRITLGVAELDARRLAKPRPVAPLA